jgi:hypothetical protein
MAYVDKPVDRVVDKNVDMWITLWICGQCGQLEVIHTSGSTCG